jgi:SPP1 gp7 family putative phage head morphogenesis protein
VPTLSPWVPTAALALGIVTLIERAEEQALDELRGVAEQDDGHAELSPLLLALLLPRMVRALERGLGNAIVHTVIARTGEQARAAAERKWQAELGRVGAGATVDSGTVRGIVRAWVAENTARVQGLRIASLEMIRRDLEAAVAEGRRPSQILADWQERGLPTRHGRLSGRALVIARDQLAKLAAKIAQAQAQQIGAQTYQWDARPGVPRRRRRAHQVRHGEEHRWDSPPSDGHPGHAVNCRCRARVVVDAPARSR